MGGPYVLLWVLVESPEEAYSKTGCEFRIFFMTVPNSEGTVLIDYQTVTAAGLAAARRAGSPS